MVMLIGFLLNDVIFLSDDVMCGWIGFDKYCMEIKLLVVFLCRFIFDKNGL